MTLLTEKGGALPLSHPQIRQALTQLQELKSKRRAWQEGIDCRQSPKTGRGRGGGKCPNGRQNMVVRNSEIQAGSWRQGISDRSGNASSVFVPRLFVCLFSISHEPQFYCPLKSRSERLFLLFHFQYLLECFLLVYGIYFKRLFTSFVGQRKHLRFT